MKKYFVNSAIPLAFTVTVNGAETNPDSVTVNAYGPDGKRICSGNATIKKAEASFVIENEYVTVPGEYTIVFSVFLKEYGEKNHTMKVPVLSMPVKPRIQRAELRDTESEKENQNARY